MGLSIHYSGTIRDKSLLPQLAAEVKDICEGLGWDYHYFEADQADDLEGIYFAPEECEPLFLTFNTDGRLLSPVSQITRDLLVEHGLDPELIYTISCKTQFAGMDAHVALIRLFRYLKDKYFSDFEMNDEGGYWESDERELLLQQFTRYENAMASLSEMLQELKSVQQDSPESVACRIEQLLKKRKSTDPDQ